MNEWNRVRIGSIECRWIINTYLFVLVLWDELGMIESGLYGVRSIKSVLLIQIYYMGKSDWQKETMLVKVSEELLQALNSSYKLHVEIVMLNDVYICVYNEVMKEYEIMGKEKWTWVKIQSTSPVHQSVDCLWPVLRGCKESSRLMNEIMVFIHDHSLHVICMKVD